MGKCGQGEGDYEGIGCSVASRGEDLKGCCSSGDLYLILNLNKMMMIY